jgi:hypothetical protein
VTHQRSSIEEREFFGVKYNNFKKVNYENDWPEGSREAQQREREHV